MYFLYLSDFSGTRESYNLYWLYERTSIYV